MKVAVIMEGSLMMETQYHLNQNPTPMKVKIDER